jgi:hypothetical protein
MRVRTRDYTAFESSPLHVFAKLYNPYYHNQGLDYGRLLENLKADGNDLDTYLTGFRWDESRYPINQSLKNLTDIISKKVGLRPLK